MTRQSATARRAEELLGAAVVATAPVAGGDICTATRLKLSDGRNVLMKTLTPAPSGFFEAEARGLAWLAEAGGAAAPAVLAADAECVLLPWIETGKPTPDAAASSSPTSRPSASASVALTRSSRAVYSRSNASSICANRSPPCSTASAVRRETRWGRSPSLPRCLPSGSSV